MHTHKNILIIGGGLAGSFLAAESALAGHRVTLADDARPQAASRIAAGLFNVVTGRKARRTWLAESLLEAMHDFFKHPAFQDLKKHIHFQTIYRPYKTEEEVLDWQARSADPEYAPLVRHCPEPRMEEQIINPMGGIEILPCGWADTTGLLDGIRNRLLTHYDFRLHPERIEYDKIQADTGEVEIFGETEVFDEIIFAEGVLIRDNPWFGWMDIRPLKGQIIDFHLEGFKLDFVLLRKVFMVSKGNNFYTAGSTYEQTFANSDPNEEGVKKLKDHVSAAIKLPFEVRDARASIRPTTPDRRPVMGRHDDFPRLFVFNGLGAKGVLQAPWCAGHMRAWMDGKLPEMLKEVRLKRFHKEKFRNLFRSKEI